MDKDLFKKCKKCVKFNKNETCSFYDFDLAETHYIYCEFDKRKICELCSNYDKETSFCKIAQKGKFRDETVLRICNDFKLRKV